MDRDVARDARRGRDQRRDDRDADRGDQRRDDRDAAPREAQRAAPPIVERERAIVPLDPPSR